MQNGFSEDVAFALDDITRTAFSIICSELHGATFDWNTMSFKDGK